MRKNIRIPQPINSDICMCIKRIKKYKRFVCYSGLSKNDIKIARALIKKRDESTM